MKTTVKHTSETKPLILVSDILTGRFADTGRKEIRAGYGSCYKCNCKAYEGNAIAYSNCGHSFGGRY